LIIDKYIVVKTSRSFPHSWLITGFVTRLTRRVPLVEQELITLPVFSGVRVTRSLTLYICFVFRCLSICPLSFGHCVFCSSSIYGFWLPLWYLQTLVVLQKYFSKNSLSHNCFVYILSAICFNNYSLYNCYINSQRNKIKSAILE
jgi:hypothetical protein